MKKKRQAPEILRYLEALKDEMGRACVDIRLDADTALYDPLSIGENLDLDGAIYEFIERQTNIIPAGIPLRIRFHGRALPQEEQETIRQIMRRHYTMQSYDVMWDMAVNFRKMILFALFGAAMLVGYFYLAFTTDRIFATEILSIIGSFSLWEAADALFLERPRLRREYANMLQNIKQTVEFLDE